ncbi:MAG: hypothetical protein ACT4PP_12055 [Sporichthyaceae bacterium]
MRGKAMGKAILGRGLAAGVLSASLLTGLSGPVAAGGEQEAGISGPLHGAALVRFPSFAALPHSLDLRAPVLLSGRLHDLGGAPVIGASVLIAAWPSPQTLGRLHPGARSTSSHWPVPPRPATAPTNCGRC